ncbi:4287_t:CDS:2 [Funneliformis geosporum]|nr:4287_t:CDS:2 [Funneliformis geosporum]
MLKITIESKDKPNQDNPDRNDNPDENPEPTDKKEDKFVFYGDSLEKSGYSKFEGEGDNFYLFYISKNHPRIKALLSEGKLQKDKQFTIRYGKADSAESSGLILTFNENNQDLEIIEVKEPSPVPNPNPQPENNKGFHFVSTKINDNTYKYKIALDVDGGEIDFTTFITFLRAKDELFFQAFQGALKDANSKFPAEVILGKLAVSFPNKPSGSQPSDAILVIPTLKPASEVAEKLSEELKKGDAPRWLSTHGIGVKYLHVRIDEKPKYYSYVEYKKTLSIAIKENTYQELRQKIGLGKISSFVNQAVEKELFKLTQEEKKEKEKLKQQLIKGYQDQTRNRKLKKMLQTYGKMSWEDISTELTAQRIKEIGKDYRPVLIISNDERNEYSFSVVGLPLTTDNLENILPAEVFIKNTKETGLDEPSKILCDSPFT